MQLRSVLAILPCALVAIAVPIAAPQLDSATTSAPTSLPGLPSLPSPPGDFSTGLSGGPGEIPSGGFPTGAGGPGGSPPGGSPTSLPGGPGGGFPGGPDGGPPGGLPAGLPALGGGKIKRDFTETIFKRQKRLSSLFVHQPLTLFSSKSLVFNPFYSIPSC